MAAWSCYGNAFIRAFQGRINSVHLRLPCKPLRTEAVRLMSSGHGRTMIKRPPTFEWRQYRDHLHFYFLLGLIPSGIIVTYTNLFIGPSELADIPEDYHPKHWEYYKHPISRFLARYVFPQEEMLYERNLHFVNFEHEKVMMRKLNKKVNYLASERQDSRRWYFIPDNRYERNERIREYEEERSRHNLKGGYAGFNSSDRSN